MRAPPPLALGCISLVLGLLERSDGLARTDGRHRRYAPDRSPPPSSLLGDTPGPQPLALAQPAGTLRHSPKLAPHHRPRIDAHLPPQHRLLTPKRGARLGARLALQHRLFTPKLSTRRAPQHRLLIPKNSARLGARLPPRHRLLVLKHGARLGARLPPRHRLLVLKHGARLGARLPPRQSPRGRRHALGRLQPGQVLRVGCVLGTCQVQNLSHRLWQLMGQSGRQDSSPMNPNSPHSYG